MKKQSPKSAAPHKVSHSSPKGKTHSPFFDPSSESCNPSVIQKKEDAFFSQKTDTAFFQPKAETPFAPVIQSKSALNATTAKAQKSSSENKTGLPDTLKTGIENLSAYSMDDVKVHYNSDKPAQLQAHAYAQGTDIHVASGQEKHLPHEAWHVVQQKQGRVKPTMQMKGNRNLNDDVGLEKEADEMGGKAFKRGDAENRASGELGNVQLKNEGVIQRVVLYDVDMEKLNEEQRTGTFMGAREFTDEFEIYQSASRLADLYHMKKINIRKERKTLSASEAVILVGHGGAGRFMSMEVGELQKLLLQWGLTKGMQVVLAGCSSAAAKEVIAMIEAITERTPIVNNDLAFTSEEHEFTVKDEESNDLFRERNDELNKIDYAYCDRHINLILNLINAPDQSTYSATLTTVNKLCKILGQGQFAPGKYSPKKGPALLAHLDAAVNRALGDGKINTRLKRVNKLQRELTGGLVNSLGDSGQTYMDEHRKLWTEAHEAARAVNNSFLAKMEAQLEVQHKDYTVDAMKKKGPLAPILKVKLAVQEKFREEGIVNTIMQYLPGQASFDKAVQQERE